MNRHSIRLLMCMVVGAWMFAAPPTTRGQSLLDQDYRQQRPEVGKPKAGAPAAWTIVDRQGITALENRDPSQPLELELNPAAHQPLSIVLEYGWRSGRGPGATELQLVDASGASVLILIRQAAGQKYEIRTGGPQSTLLGKLDSQTLDAGVQAGGVAETPAVLSVQLAADGQQLTLRRLGGASTSVKLPEPLHPTKLILRDVSRAVEQTRLYRVRAFSGATDPVSQPVEFSMPFGASFVQGREIPTIRLLGRWFSDERRPAHLSLHAQAVPSVDDEKPLPLELDAQVHPGERVELQAPSLGELPPGLYRLSGTLTIGDQKQVIEARFAILDANLADRSQEQIPQWMGMVPAINTLPREVYPESFEYMDKIGVRHVRWLPGWGRLEPEKGQYEWAESDEFMDLVQRHQMQAMFCLSYYGGDWANAETRGQLARTPEGRQMWVERFAVPTIQRYGDRVKLWQIWNEPDAFWNDDPAKATGFATAFGSPANYFDLVKRTYIAAHKLGIPGLRIMASVSSGNIPQSTRKLFDLGLGDYFDGMIIHTYGHHVRHFQLLRKQLANLGHPDPALGSGESGAPRAGDWDSAIRQAQRVVHQFLSSTTIPNLLCVEHFVLHDGVAGGNFGIIDAHMQPHPAALAYFTTARLLSGTTSGEIESRGTMTVYRVQRKDHPPLMVLVNAGRPTLVTLQVNAVNAADAPVLWNLFGQRRKPQLQDGVFNVDVSDTVFIEGDVSIKTVVAPVISITIDDQTRVGVTVSAGGGELAGVSVHLSVPDLEVDERQALDPSGQAHFALPSTLQPGRQYPAELSLDIPGAPLREQTLIEATLIHRVSSQDAQSLTAPRGLPRIVLDSAESFHPFNTRRTFGGVDDHSAVLSMGWTDTDLVLWIEEQDDVFTPAPPAAPNPFGYDSVQWAFQPEGQLIAGAPVTDIVAGRVASGEVRARVLGQPHFSPTAQIERSGTTTRYRISIPASQLGIELKQGATFGTAVNINDNDGDGRKGWLYWGDGINPPRSPGKFRRVVLTSPFNGDGK